MQREPQSPFPAVPNGAAAGFVLVACALLMLVTMTHHPSVHTRSAAAAFAEIGRFAAVDEAVHGTLIALITALVYAFAVFSLRRGFNDQTALAGLVAYAVGSLALIGAGLIDGFVIPGIVGAYRGEAASALTGGVAVLRLCGSAIQAATAFGFAAISVAIGSWSIGLFRVPLAPVRAAAGVGSLAAVVPIVVFVASGSVFTAHGLVWLLLPQAVWYVVIGALLIRRTL